MPHCSCPTIWSPRITLTADPVSQMRLTKSGSTRIRGPFSESVMLVEPKFKGKKAKEPTVFQLAISEPVKNGDSDDQGEQEETIL